MQLETKDMRFVRDASRQDGISDELIVNLNVYKGKVTFFPAVQHPTVEHISDVISLYTD